MGVLSGHFRKNVVPWAVCSDASGGEPMVEKRITPRTRVLKGAVISFRQLGTTIDCTVRDLSSAGACLTVTSPAGVPNEFDLMLDREKLTRHCRVAWRGADRIGVAFEKPMR